jgi:hypothetical protein
MAGKFLGSLFGNGAGARGSAEVGHTAPPEEDDLRRAGTALVDLRRFVRRSGARLPPVVYSQLRQIDDLLAALIRYIDGARASTEQLVLLEAMVSDYLPGAVRAYLLLSEPSRQDYSAETKALLSQLKTLHLTALNLDNQVRTGAVTELAVHGRFLQDKFDLGSLHLEGR